MENDPGAIKESSYSQSKKYIYSHDEFCNDKSLLESTAIPPSSKAMAVKAIPVMLP